MYFQQIRNICKKFYSDLEQNNNKLIRPYQLDLVIPQIKFALQFNGLKYHSQLVGIDKFYHQRKYQLCKNKNYDLLIIWDFQWKKYRQQIENKLLAYLVKQKIRPLNLSIIQQEQMSSSHQYLSYKIYENDTLVAIFTYLGHTLIEYTCNYMYDSIHVLGFILDTLEIKRITKEIRCGQQNELPYIRNGFKIDKMKTPRMKEKWQMKFYDAGCISYSLDRK